MPIKWFGSSSFFGTVIIVEAGLISLFFSGLVLESFLSLVSFVYFVSTFGSLGEEIDAKPPSLSFVEVSSCFSSDDSPPLLVVLVEGIPPSALPPVESAFVSAWLVDALVSVPVVVEGIPSPPLLLSS